jgi:DNA-binding GntR family transcriptional regulator
VFQVRRLLEAEMVREFIRTVTPAKIKALREHIAQEKAAMAVTMPATAAAAGRLPLRIAELAGNGVLAQILRDLVSRSSLITLMYQRDSFAAHSQEEHVELVKAWPRRTRSAR